LRTTNIKTIAYTQHDYLAEQNSRRDSVELLENGCIKAARLNGKLEIPKTGQVI
jgi:hypothetical protein